MSATATLQAIQQADEDFEWYPTTGRMIETVAAQLPAGDTDVSIMDIGAGDGRVLTQLARRFKSEPTLYAIEKSIVLMQAQPDEIVPVGTDFYEQNLACLPVDYIFCNPPYSQFEVWAANIIEHGYAKYAYLIIPQRWKDSKRIKAAIEARGASARVIGSDHFADAERRARAVVDIIEVRYPKTQRGYNDEVKDPFDIWFDQNIDTFDQAQPVDEFENRDTDLARIRDLDSIPELVKAYSEEYARMEDNYRAIFRLDYAILKELGINKDTVREGIKTKMTGLKNKYWGALFEKLDTITSRLTTRTKAAFLDKLNGRSAIAFTANNAYAVCIWAVKNANQYFDQQTVQLFRDLSTFEGVENYKSNTKTWEKRDGWRYHAEDQSHYKLDYRVVVQRGRAIYDGQDYGRYEYPGDLYRGCHELIDDIRAVLNNLGYASPVTRPSRKRDWVSGQWQNFGSVGDEILFQVKAHKNGNLHLRFAPAAIKALNVEAGRLLKWLQTPADVEDELGYTASEAANFFHSTIHITAASVGLLPASATETA